MSDDDSQTQGVTRLDYPCPTYNCKQKLASGTYLDRHVMKLHPGAVHHVRISPSLLPASAATPFMLLLSLPLTILLLFLPLLQI